ncbi:MAG: HAD family hydrolase [Actinobacteria bacterium]|nr:HAD family hydrolase [Actinomycetota bacterium]
MASPWLIGIDIDGTLVHDDGSLSKRVVDEVQRVRSQGHKVVIATGRAAANAYPVIKDLGLDEGFAVCSNGAVTIELGGKKGYHVVEVKTFDPAEILALLIEKLPNAHFAVEDVDGSYRFNKPFPTYALGDQNFEADLNSLSHHPVSRVVVLSPDHDVDEFLGIIEDIGLQSVSYAIGYTAWLDIAPKGIDKGHGLERIRTQLGIPGEQVVVMGDGRNDIEMFRWAKDLGGYAFAMGQAPDEVKLEATAVTASVEDDGVAQVLSSVEGLQFLD